MPEVGTVYTRGPTPPPPATENRGKKGQPQALDGGPALSCLYSVHARPEQVSRTPLVDVCATRPQTRVRNTLKGVGKAGEKIPAAACPDHGSPSRDR